MLITNATIITHDTKNRVIANGAVLVEGGVIRDVGTTSALIKKHPKAKRHDANGMVLMPGMINAHMHFYSTLARGMAIPGRAPQNFDQILKQLWWKLDKALRPKDIEVSALIPLLSGIRAGTTTVIDHHASPNAVKGSLCILADVARRCGVRTALCYEVSDRDGREIAEEGIEENARFLRRVKREDSSMLKGLFGLHAQFTIGDKTLREAAEAAKDLGAGVHIHCAEGISDTAKAHSKYSVSPVERLHRAGLLGSQSLLAHCIHITQRDATMLRETDTFVTHQPRSNMNNSVGAMDIALMRKSRVNLALGTDGMSSSVWDEMRTCHLLHNHQTQDPRVGFGEALTMAFDGNRRLAERHFGVKMGRIAKGHVADLILIDYPSPTPLTSATVGGHLIFGLGDYPVDSTMVNGKWLMRGRKIRLRGIDEQAIAEEAMACAKRVWKRL